MIKFTEFLNITDEPLNEAQLKYDIPKKYDYYNNKLFGGTLPTNFAMKFSRTKSVGGKVTTNYWFNGRGNYKRVTKWEIVDLILSTFYLRTEEQIDSILVHEMIHIWLTVNERHEGYNIKLHGPEFVAKMNELQSKVPFQLSLYDTPSMRSGDITSRTISGSTLTIGCAITLINGIPDSISTFTEKALIDNQEKIKDMILKYVKPGTEIILGTSSHPSLEKFKIKRTISSFSLYMLDNSHYDNLRQDFNEIMRVKKEGTTSAEDEKKKLTDKLYSLTMKMISMDKSSREYEEMKLQVNGLRAKLNMELI